MMMMTMFATRSSPAWRSAYGVTDENAYAVAPEDALDALEGGEGGAAERLNPPPTKRKNHIKRMKQREAFIRENARVHKENERRAAEVRQAKRLERWRAAAARKAEYESTLKATGR
jgi:hypothetical protein